MISTPPLHCWAGRDEETDPTWDSWADDKSYTCMLPRGHEGPHEWTPDDKITVTFEPAPHHPKERT